MKSQLCIAMFVVSVIFQSIPANGQGGAHATTSVPSGIGDCLESLSNEYSQMVEDVCAELKLKLESPHDDAVPAIKTAGDIRASKAKGMLLQILAYPLYPAYRTSSPELGVNGEYRHFFGVFPNSRETRWLEGCYPSYGALSLIGVSFPEVTNSLPLYAKSGIRDNIFARLGRQSAGYYFEEYLCTLIASGEDENALIKEMTNHRFGNPVWSFFGKERGYTNYNIQACNRYDAMQDELISRFKSQLENGDAELADTIHTMGFIRSDKAMPLLIENLTVCPQTATISPSGLVFPAAEALISIWPPLGICFEQLAAAQPMSVQESLWLRITHEVYPEAVEYDLMKKAEQGDRRATRLLTSLPWRRLGVPKADSEKQPPVAPQ